MILPGIIEYLMANRKFVHSPLLIILNPQIDPILIPFLRNKTMFINNKKKANKK